MNLPELIKTITESELEEAFLVLEKRVYLFPNKKATYKISGIMRDEKGLIFQFVDNVLQVDSVELSLHEIPSQLHDDLLRVIREVI